MSDLSIFGPLQQHIVVVALAGVRPRSRGPPGQYSTAPKRAFALGSRSGVHQISIVEGNISWLPGHEDPGWRLLAGGVDGRYRTPM